MPIIPALSRLRQEDLKFQASLGYTVTLCTPKHRYHQKITEKNRDYQRRNREEKMRTKEEQDLIKV